MDTGEDIPHLVTSPVGFADRDLGMELLKTEFLKRAGVLMNEVAGTGPATRIQHHP